MSGLQEFIASKTPPGWSTKPLWSLFRRRKRTGYADEELLSVYRDYGVIPKSSRDDNFNKESEDLSNYQLVTQGALVTNKMKAWQGSIAISRYRGIVSPAYYVYEPLSDEYDQFLHYLLRSDPYIALYGRISKGVRVNQWDLEHEALRNVPIMLPDRDTQKAIADFLDRETARIDQLIEKKQRLLELLREKEEAELARMVTRGLNSECPMLESIYPWNPDFPSHWTETPLGLLMRRTRHNVGSRPSEYRLLSLGKQGVVVRDIESGKGKFPTDFDTYQEVRPGQIVLCLFDLDETPRTVGLSSITGMVTGAYDVMTVTGHASAEYLYLHLLYLDHGKRLRPFYSGLRKVVRMPTFRTVRIPLPPPPEQRAIVEQYKKLKDKLTALDSRTRKSVKQLREFRAALITAAVTGQIDVATWSKRGTGDRRLDQIEEELTATTGGQVAMGART